MSEFKDLNEEEFIIYVAADQGIEEAIDYLCKKGIILGSLTAGCNNWGTVEVSDIPLQKPQRRAPRMNLNDFPTFLGDDEGPVRLSQNDNEEGN